MPQINRIRVNNVKYNFGTQVYDDFVMRFNCQNTIYDLANGGGKSLLMLLLMQNMLPNCTLDDKQPIEKLFRQGSGNTCIHSLVEWKLDPLKPVKSKESQNLLAAFTLITIRIAASGNGLPHPGGDGVECNGALQTLALHLAGHLVGLGDVVVHQQIGGGAAAAAIEPGPALPAGGPGVDVRIVHISGVPCINQGCTVGI